MKKKILVEILRRNFESEANLICFYQPTFNALNPDLNQRFGTAY